MKLRIAVAFMLLGIAVLAVVRLSAQSVTLVFEVASIKANKSGGMLGPGAAEVGSEAGGRFVMRDGTGMVLLRSAFPDATDVVGAPPWLSSERYDVEAKARGPATRAEIAVMLKTLLEDRFTLTAHYESRNTPVYSLTLARADGRLGPQLRQYQGDCASFLAAAQQGRDKPLLPPPSNGAVPCGYGLDGRGVLAGGISMARLATVLQGYVERPVVDKTGLLGYYEFKLDVVEPAEAFTAVREQLGLRLDADRAQLPVLVIDRIERPTGD